MKIVKHSILATLIFCISLSNLKPMEDEFDLDNSDIIQASNEKNNESSNWLVRNKKKLALILGGAAALGIVIFGLHNLKKDKKPKKPNKPNNTNPQNPPSLPTDPTNPSMGPTGSGSANTNSYDNVHYDFEDAKKIVSEMVNLNNANNISNVELYILLNDIICKDYFSESTQKVLWYEAFKKKGIDLSLGLPLKDMINDMKTIAAKNPIKPGTALDQKRKDIITSALQSQSNEDDDNNTLFIPRLPVNDDWAYVGGSIQK